MFVSPRSVLRTLADEEKRPIDISPNSQLGSWLRSYKPGYFDTERAPIQYSLSTDVFEKMCELRDYADSHLSAGIKAVICDTRTPSHLDRDKRILFLSPQMLENVEDAKAWIKKHADPKKKCTDEACNKQMYGMWYTCAEMCTAFRGEHYSRTAYNGNCVHCRGKLYPLLILMDVAMGLGNEHWWTS